MNLWERFLRPAGRSLRSGLPRIAIPAVCIGSTLFNPTPTKAADSPVNVLTYHYDNSRTGWNPNEPQLSPEAIRSQAFGLLSSVALDDQVDAQPLLVGALNIDGSTRQVLYIVTESNTVWAIDAITGAVLKHEGFGAPVPESMITCNNNGDNVGVTGTPVIDTTTNTMYLVAFTLDNGRPAYYLHALDLITLKDRVPPRLVAAANVLLNGKPYPFDASVSRQRAGLVLTQTGIFAGFGSFCDHKFSSTRGWLLGWDNRTLDPLPASQLTDLRATAPPPPSNWFLTSIWMSGYGIAADPSGNLFFITGNSHYQNYPKPIKIDPHQALPESVVKVRADLGGIMDYFTPSDLAALDADDLDFGSGGVMLIPAQGSGPAKHLAVAAGKTGDLYLLDQDDLGKFDSSGKNHVLGSYSIGPCWCGPSYFVGPDGKGRIVTSGGDSLIVWQINQGATGASLSQENKAKLMPGVSGSQTGFLTVVSSNGNAPESAVIWAIQRPTTKPPTLTLRAFDAKDGSPLLPSGIPAGAWPNTGGRPNAVPVVANGKVFVASYKELRIFGLGSKQPAPTQPLQVATIAAPHTATIYGTVIQIKASTLWLRTRTDVLTIDVGQVQHDQLTVPLVPGKAVRISARIDERGTISAEEIDYAPESPALWTDGAR